MALPTPAKTYLISQNNLITSNGPLPSPWQSRAYDIATVLCTMVTRLISLTAAGPSITHVASSVPTSRSLVPGTNVWDISVPANAAGIAAFGNTLIQTSNSGFGTPWTSQGSFSPWVVLQLPSGGQICMGFYYTPTWPASSGSGTWKISYSPGGLFGASFAGLANLGIPTASDELLLDYQAFQPVYGSTYYGGFDNDSQGILNTAQNRGSYNHQLQVAVANDATGFWVGSFRDNACAFFMYFSLGLENALGTGPWASCPIFYLDRAPVFNRMIESGGSNFKAVFTGNSGWVFRGAALYAHSQWVRWSPLVDTDLGSYAIYPIPFYGFSPGGSPTGPTTGLKGVMRDFWLGQTQTSPAVYPATPPTQFVQVADGILPWNTSVADPLFIG